MISTNIHIPRHLLKDGSEIPRIIAGGWQLSEGHTMKSGEVNPQLDNFRALLQNGIDAFDCADIYNGVEERFGSLRECLLRKDPSQKIRIHTKFVPDLNVLGDISAEYIDSIVERSLQRLRASSLDLLQFHWWDFSIEKYVETARYLTQLQSRGKIKSLGVTNFDVPRLSELLDCGVPIVSHQIQYSLLDRRAQNSMVDFARRHDIALLCYGSLAGGFLTEKWVGKTRPDQFENRSLIKYSLIIEEFGGWDIFQELLQILHVIGKAHDTSLSVVALSATLQMPGVGALIVGMPKPHQIKDILRVFSVHLSEEEMVKINSVLAQARNLPGDIYSLEREKEGKHGAIMRYNLNSR